MHILFSKTLCNVLSLPTINPCTTSLGQTVFFCLFVFMMRVKELNIHKELLLVFHQNHFKKVVLMVMTSINSTKFFQEDL